MKPAPQRLQRLALRQRPSGIPDPACVVEPLAERRRHWLYRPLPLAMAGGALLWAAFPPLGWWPLAWIAPIFWLLLILQPELSGRRTYLAIWLAGMLHWAAVVQGIRLAHPLLYLGWLSLAGYLAVYLVLFVGLTRVAVHRLGMPIVLAAPAVWTGLELIRGHAITGFSIALLGHSQVHWVPLIQVADLGGAYAVSFTIMAVAAALASWVPSGGGRVSAAGRRWSTVAAAALLACVLGYGFWRQAAAGAGGGPAKTLKVALIQGSFDTVFEADAERDATVFSRYLQLSRQAVQQHPDVDLVVWPESAFTGTLGDVTSDGPIEPPEDLFLSAEEFRRAVRIWGEAFAEKTRNVAEDLNGHARRAGAATPAIWMIVGSDTQSLSGREVRRFNSALLIDPQGHVASRYGKMHLVMFGEYIPLGSWLPLLYQITPMSGGLTPGAEAESFHAGPATIAPSVCFESTVPHLIRRQLTSLRAAGSDPEVLVNVTNDGWFWGSSILDLHLACAVFRAVENRLPMLVAANTGLSACIDSTGRIEQRGPRRAEAILYARVRCQPQISWYLRLGDFFAGGCLLFCGAVSIVGTRDRLLGRKRRKSPE